ncbi:hypothetical protein TcWFU_000467 [Taenia crassiceps]|uniref:Uncharacterized protein n=1 Tax=Taenia crassiceps TaxID=6207 RepID=A0ABR4Q1R7_9CEST
MGLHRGCEDNQNSQEDVVAAKGQSIYSEATRTPDVKPTVGECEAKQVHSQYGVCILANAFILRATLGCALTQRVTLAVRCGGGLKCQCLDDDDDLGDSVAVPKVRHLCRPLLLTTARSHPSLLQPLEGSTRQPSRMLLRSWTDCVSTLQCQPKFLSQLHGERHILSTEITPPYLSGDCITRDDVVGDRRGVLPLEATYDKEMLPVDRTLHYTLSKDGVCKLVVNCATASGELTGRPFPLRRGSWALRTAPPSSAAAKHSPSVGESTNHSEPVRQSLCKKYTHLFPLRCIS